MTREECIKWLKSLKTEIGKSEHRTLWHYAEAIDTAIEALQNEETLKTQLANCHKEILRLLDFNDITESPDDVIEVVRCKDCRWWNGSKETMHNNHLCRNWSKFGSINTSADDFCSYGERKGGDSE